MDVYFCFRRMVMRKLIYSGRLTYILAKWIVELLKFFENKLYFKFACNCLQLLMETGILKKKGV